MCSTEINFYYWLMIELRSSHSLAKDSFKARISSDKGYSAHEMLENLSDSQNEPQQTHFKYGSKIH